MELELVFEPEQEPELVMVGLVLLDVGLYPGMKKASLYNSGDLEASDQLPERYGRHI